MRLALIGKGKTGGQVLDLYDRDNITVFDSKNPVSVAALQKCDIAIVFIPGNTFDEIMPILIESKIPVVTGATGLDFSTGLDKTLKDQQITWITGSNFSLGMRIVHQMIKNLQLTSTLFSDYQFKMHEVHHVNKVDGPSGTALSWEQWLGEKTDITFDRTCDVVGDHQLVLDTPFEKITLRHEALDRKIFAQGALWAAEYLLSNLKNDYGLKYFEDITSNILTKK